MTVSSASTHAGWWPVIRRWYLTGAVLSIGVGTAAAMPMHVEHGALLPFGTRVLMGGTLFAMVGLYLALPVLIALAGWARMVRRWLPMLETTAWLRWTALLVLGAVLPSAIWFVTATVLEAVGAPSDGVPYVEWQISGSSIRLDGMWLYLRLPIAAWILLPRLLLPSLRAPLPRREDGASSPVAPGRRRLPLRVLVACALMQPTLSVECDAPFALLGTSCWAGA